MKFTVRRQQKFNYINGKEIYPPICDYEVLGISVGDGASDMLNYGIWTIASTGWSGPEIEPGQSRILCLSFKECVSETEGL
jgi:hypothetical protein